MSSDLQFYINTRKYTRKLVTECHNRRNEFSAWSISQKVPVKEALQDHLDQLKRLNNDIQRLKWSEEEVVTWLDKELETCEGYFVKIRECNALLKENATPSSASLDTARSLLKSPIAPLPEFKSGEGEDLLKFFKDFEGVTSMFKYSEYDRLILLKQQISGRALILLNSLESDKQGYVHAKELLTTALASKDSQVFSVIKQLCEMKMTYESDPFGYVSKMRNITETVNRLSLDKESFLRYFFWQGMNETFKTHMTQITNSSKPTLDQINVNFFEAAERYQVSRKNFDKRNSVSSEKVKGSNTKVAVGYAANVEYEKASANFKPCSLCTNLDKKDASHPIFKCDIFVSARAKVDKIVSLHGCAKCSNLNHTPENCRYRFHAKCKFCNGWHFSFLCVESQKEKTDKAKSSKATPKQANSSLAVTEALRGSVDSDCSILPTFSCNVKGRRIRVLKDGGCQSNFISEHLVNSLNLEILDKSVDLRINGINVAQNYRSKLVKVELDFGREKRLVEALSIPSIKIDLSLPGLGRVVRGFKNKGYKLADACLLDSDQAINNIDFILGTKSGYCMPDSEIVFGWNLKSVYSQTSYGIMLRGDVDTLLDDVGSLPPVAELISDVSVAEVDMDSKTAVGLSHFGIEFKESTSLTVSSVCNPVEVCSNFQVVDKEGRIIKSALESATNEVLNSSCDYHTNFDGDVYEEEASELNEQLTRFCLDHTSRNEEGRLVMPLLWNAQVSHLLGQNLKLSKLILQSNFKKLSKNPTHFKLMDEAIREQEEAGVIERVENLDQFLQEHPACSFLPHMGVFKLSRETTKCRVVFLSNLCEKDWSKSLTISHNQAIHAGPCLNQKLSSSLLHLRFDRKLLCFDLCKAFNQIALEDTDADKLLFLWYRNVNKNDFEIVAYRNVRLSFGLRCSPTVLLLGLYKILMLDTEHDSKEIGELKECIYSLCYMDNCAYTVNDSSKLKWAYDNLHEIFAPYKFDLQQFVTNDQNLQRDINSSLKVETPEVVKLLGVQWDRNKDTLSTKPLQLDVKARTKREILRTVASQFDLFNYNGPILNRSRLFLHDLQCKKELRWDDELSPELVKEWRNIARQANSTPEIVINRFVGRRDGTFRLVAFCDSSKLIFGVVVFIVDVDSGEVSFLLAKNRLVNKQLECKSIPSLEMQAVALATEVVLDLYKELAGPACVKPLDIVRLEVFSDSLVALSWLNSYANKMSKMQKRSVFVMNRIYHINRLCEQHPVNYAFISGEENPADAITRCFSFRKLRQTNYYSGPDFLRNNKNPELSQDDTLSFTVPNPLASKVDEDASNSHGINTNTSMAVVSEMSGHLVLPSRCSTFQGLTSVYCNVLKFVQNLKSRLKRKDPSKFENWVISDQNLFLRARKQVILRDQREHFPEIFKYFEGKDKTRKELPNLISQLNLYVDQDGLLRVHSKCDKLKKRANSYKFPLLLAKNSPLTSLIIQDLHKMLSHAGCYSVLAEMRKRFYVPHYFTVVKRTLRECISCRRFKERTIKLNQSPYREWRICPPNVPYRYIFMDFIGPVWVKQNGKKEKAYLLCITCMWSRAINLLICLDLSVKEFLRAFQIHCFQYGLPEYCISDLGSQLVSASSIITDYLKDHHTQSYFEQNGVQSIKFDHFNKGHSQLGSMVEVCVKLVKRLIFGAVKKNILDYRDFEYLIAQTIHLVNRRPIAFKEALRDAVGDDIPEPITPETLIHGYDLISVNVIPELHLDSEPDWQPGNSSESIRNDYHQLQKVRNNLTKLYREEFLANLIHQAVDVKDRYKPVTHKSISPGDIVLLKEQFTKPNDYPMGLVKKVDINCNGEVTGATILKGKTRELVKRHSSAIIPLLTRNESGDLNSSEQTEPSSNSTTSARENKDKKSRPKRKAAKVSAQRTKEQLQD